MTGSTRNTILWLLVVLFHLSGCSMSGSSAHRFRLYEEDGVQIAVTTGGPKYATELFEYEELYRLEQDASREETLLGTARMALMDENGTIFVNDLVNFRVAVFSPDGSFSHSIGGEGGGPGEFRRPSLTGFFDDMVAVSDFRQSRTNLFSKDGVFVRAFRFPRMNSISGVSFITMSVWPYPGGGSVLIQQGLSRGRTEPLITFRGVLLDADGEVQLDIRAPRASVPRDFEGLPMVQYFPGVGFCRSLVEEPVLEIFDMTGTLRKRIRIDRDPEPVRPADRKLIHDFDQQWLETIEGVLEQESARRELEELSFPSYKSFWSEVTLGTDGYYWASIPGYLRNDSVSGEARRVLSPEGEYLGVTSFPEVAAISSTARLDYGHLLLMYQAHETGAPVVTVYRIRSTIDGFDYP